MSFLDFYVYQNGSNYEFYTGVENVQPYNGEDSVVSGELVTAAPEPGTMALLGIGLIGLAVMFRRKSALARANPSLN